MGRAGHSDWDEIMMTGQDSLVWHDNEVDFSSERVFGLVIDPQQ